MVSQAGPICCSVASIERGSAVRSGVLSLDQHSSIGDTSGEERGTGSSANPVRSKRARLREAMGGAMVHDDGGARLVLAPAGDHNRLQKRRNHRPVGGGGHGHDGDHTAAGERAEHRALLADTSTAAASMTRQDSCGLYSIACGAHTSSAR
jgi:hypothetical protein